MSNKKNRQNAKKTSTRKQAKPKLSMRIHFRTNWIGALAALVFLAAFISAALILNKPDEDAIPTFQSTRMYVSAKVVEVLEDNASPDTWTEGLRIGNQQLLLEIRSGEHKGERLSATNYMSAYYNVDAKVGTRLVILLETDEDGGLKVTDIFNYDRRFVTGGFVLLFCVALVVIGGKKGLAALAGLVFTLVCLWALLIPLIMRGVPPIPVTILIVVLTTAVSLLLLNGPSVKTLCAILGCVAGVTIAGISAFVVGKLTPLGGFNMPEAEELILRARDSGMTISGLLVCGILIASLGAVMDVAMALASSINELHEVNPKLTAGALFKSGMNIGRDAMGTMANTLILAFVGASLNTLILFRVFDYPLIQLINSNLISIEILRGIAGSIGIILTVPIVAFISSQIIVRHPVKQDKSAASANAGAFKRRS